MTFGSVTTNDLAAFLADQFAAELQMFRAALAEVPPARFGTEDSGHSAAWHALHVADWLRLTVLQDRTPNHQYLGWEDRPWVQTMNREPAPVDLQAGRDAVLARLDEVIGQTTDTLRALTPEDLAGPTFAPSAPSGERPRLPSLGMHLRHIAYHRGQLRLALKSMQDTTMQEQA